MKHRARRRFGQHFLEPAWADKVVRAIAPSRGDRFIEIGPGPGILTERLLPRVASLTAVEVDRDLAAGISLRLPAVRLIVADFLDLDLSALLREGPVRFAGNLPYNISTPIIFKLLAAARTSDHVLDATIMLQREVADRLAARAGTKDYGVLTILTRVRTDVTRLLALPPGAFRPAPKVESAVVRLQFRPSLVPEPAEATFDRLVRTIFMQRRKTLGNALKPLADLSGTTARDALSAAGIDPVRRPETLSIDELLSLSRVLQPA